MSRKKKEQQYERKRKRYTFTLSDEAHEFLQESVTNASRFIESLIMSAKSGIKPVILTISQKGMDRAGFEPAASSMPRKREISPEMSRIKNRESIQDSSEKILEKKPEKKIQTINELWMKYHPAPERTDMESWLKGGKKTYKNEFADYMIKYKDKTAAPKKARWYINALASLPPMRNPVDVKRAYPDMKDHHIRAYRNFINFLYDMKEMEMILGYSKERWLEQVKARQPGISKSVAKEFSDGEIIAAYEHCPDDLKTFFKFLIYSGGRATQCIDVIQTFDPNNLHISKYDKRVAYYEAFDKSSGTKDVFNLFIPASFIDELKAYKMPDLHIDTIYRKIKHGKFSSSSSRKYAANLLADNEVHYDIIDFLQGRTPQSVVAKNYISLLKQSTKAYAKILDKFPI